MLQCVGGAATRCGPTKAPPQRLSGPEKSHPEILFRARTSGNREGVLPRGSRESDTNASYVKVPDRLAWYSVRHRVPDCASSTGPAERPRALPLVKLRSMIVDYDYLIRRMNEERQRAAEADSDAARAAHEAMADQYAAEIARLRAGGGPQLGLA